MIRLLNVYTFLPLLIFAVCRFSCNRRCGMGLAMDPFQDASVDPWSGKSLGEVEKPKGFDEFWKEQEATDMDADMTEQILTTRDIL